MEQNPIVTDCFYTFYGFLRRLMPDKKINKGKKTWLDLDIKNPEMMN